jgi:hypothetical protein
MNTPLIVPLLFSGIAIAQSAGTFRATGNMITPRFGHTATLLPDGRVLIAGETRSPLSARQFLTRTLPNSTTRLPGRLRLQAT